jgi:hypothetical protein
MKNAIKVYVYHANEIGTVKEIVKTFYKHPVQFTEQKTENPKTYYDNWLQIESDYALFALSRKIEKVCCGVKTITFIKENNIETPNGEKVVEKLRQAHLQKYHPTEVTTQ